MSGVSASALRQMGGFILLFLTKLSQCISYWSIASPCTLLGFLGISSYALKWKQKASPYHNLCLPYCLLSPTL